MKLSLFYRPKMGPLMRLKDRLLVFNECGSDEDPDDEADEDDYGGPEAGASDAALAAERSNCLVDFKH